MFFWFSIEKNKKIFVFFNLLKKSGIRIFFIIGVKRGKLLGMGEKIKGVKLEFGGVEKEEEVYKLLAFLPVLNIAILSGRGHPEKFKIKNKICRCNVLD